VRLDRMLPGGATDLFAGQDLVVLARYEGDGPATLHFSGQSSNGPIDWTERVTFPDRERDNAFVPRLWATQRIGWLTAEKRRGGASTEMNDEIRTLGERYAIPTEFTSYLVQEPNNVAVAPGMLQGQVGGGGRRVMAPQAAPAAADFARAKVSSMQRDARSLAEVDSAVAVSGSASAARRIGARLFVLRDSVWMDARGDASSMANLRRVRVQAYSAAYFALLRAVPELGEPFGLGDRVVVFGRKVAVEVAAGGDERLSDAQVAAVAADW
jgi:Ca-activated chloride channel family protein